LANRQTSTILSGLTVTKGSIFASARSPTASPNWALSLAWISCMFMLRGPALRPALFAPPTLAHHDVLDAHQAFGQGLGPGRAAGHVDIHRDDLVHALDHGVAALKQAAAVRAGAHGQHILGL